MSKFINASSKLGDLYNTTDLEKDSIGIAKKKKSSSKIKTFRLTDDDLKSLEKIRDSVNNNSRSNISDNKIIQALIHIGSEVEAKRIIKALADII